MKPDDFEKYVKDHRLDFGPDHDAPDVWDKVKKRAPKEVAVKISWHRWTAIAASVLVLFTISYIIYEFRANHLTGEKAQISTMWQDPRFQQLMEADEYYTAEIKDKKEELFKRASGVPDLEREINTDLADLDSRLLELKEDLGDNADNEEVIEAMIENYRLKLEILEDMLEQFNDNHNKENRHEAGISI